MALLLAPYPPSEIRSTIPENEWGAILTSWSAAIKHHLALPDPAFASAPAATTNLYAFIDSFLSGSPPPAPHEPPDSAALRKDVFLLIHRLLSSPAPPKGLLSSESFLTNYSRLYHKVPKARDLLEQVWDKHEALFDKLVARLKASVLKELLSGSLTQARISEISRVFAASPRVAAAFLAGEEFKEAAVKTGDDAAAKVFGKALIEAPKRNWSVVIDTLYELTTAGAANDKGILVKLAWYGVGTRLKAMAECAAMEGRVNPVAEKLQALGPERRRKIKDRKGKGKAIESGFHEEAEAELQSKVETIRDLFPHLGPGFARACLQHFGGDIEIVTSALLEGNVPEELGQLQDAPGVEGEKPQPSPAPSYLHRRNIHDNDALDRLTPESLSRFTRGRHSTPASADALLDTSRAPKSSIYAALAQLEIDPDEDERDDTYDYADSSGAVVEAESEAIPTDEDRKKAWVALNRNPDVFERSARSTKERADLKADTGWTDEQLEGFAYMCKTDEMTSRELKMMFRDEPNSERVEIERTKWRQGDANSSRSPFITELTVYAVLLEPELASCITAIVITKVPDEDQREKPRYGKVNHGTGGETNEMDDAKDRSDDL